MGPSLKSRLPAVLEEGKSPYAFIEIMGCPGGCLNGGGQPFIKPSMMEKGDQDILETYLQKRANILYSIDEKKTIRQSHNNPDIIKLYKDYLGYFGSEKAEEDYLGYFGSEKAEELLHTSYNAERERFPK